MEKKICETLLNTQVSNIESFFMPCFPSCIIMASSSFIHHLCDINFHLSNMTTTCATNHKHNCKRETGNYKTQSCLPKSINKFKSPKSFQCSIWLPNHGNFEEATLNIEQIKRVFSYKLWKTPKHICKREWGITRLKIILLLKKHKQYRSPKSSQCSSHMASKPRQLWRSDPNT